MNVLDAVRPFLVTIRNLVLGSFYRGSGAYCPVCERSSCQFLAAGTPPRLEAQCPSCSGRERHRLVWLFFKRKTDLFDLKQKKVLHFAPEACLEARLRKRIGEGYTTADLMNPRVMVQIDITKIPFPQNSIDVIYCSHVLEHVPDDRMAMREMLRVLRPTGWAIVLVPITASVTYEEPSIVDPKARLAAFGQEDHVRRYGPDFEDRLLEAGWIVQRMEPSDFLTDEEVDLMRLRNDAGSIFFCRKQL